MTNDKGERVTEAGPSVPVAFPYTTLDVIVRIDVVGSEFRYV